MHVHKSQCWKLHFADRSKNWEWRKGSNQKIDQNRYNNYHPAGYCGLWFKSACTTFHIGGDLMIILKLIPKQKSLANPKNFLVIQATLFLTLEFPSPMQPCISSSIHNGHKSYNLWGRWLVIFMGTRFCKSGPNLGLEISLVLSFMIWNPCSN